MSNQPTAEKFLSEARRTDAPFPTKQYFDEDLREESDDSFEDSMGVNDRCEETTREKTMH